MSEVTAQPTLGRTVIYRSRTGKYDVPAIVNCTTESVNPEGVEKGFIPALTDNMHVHLSVLTPGIPGKRTDAPDFLVEPEYPISENVGGIYQEWDIDYDEQGGPGTWRWPTRV